MASQILHIDSTYRNRLLYPNPADFVVDYGSPTGNSMFNMRNPVTNELPIYNFVFPNVAPYSQSIDFLSSGTTVSNSSLKIGISSGNYSMIILDHDDMVAIFGEQKTSNDFLTNLYFVYGDGSPYSLTKIVAFDSLTNAITLENEIEIDLTTIAYCYIYNDSLVTTDTMSIVLSGTSSDMKNYLRLQGLYMYNATTGEQLPIRLTSDQKSIVQVEFGKVFSNWSVNDFYLIFLSECKISSLIQFDDGKYVSRSVRNLRLLESTRYFQTNNKIYNLQETLTGNETNISIMIKRVDVSGTIVSFDIVSRGYNINMNTTYYIEDFDSYGNRQYALFSIADTYQTFMVSGELSLPQNEFFTPLLFTPLYGNGSFNNDEITYNVFPEEYETYENMNVDSYAPQVQNLSGSAMIYGYSITNGNTIIYTTAYEEAILSLLDKQYQNTWWNMVIFSTVTKDQFVPLNYSGSTVSQTQLNCYEIQLLNLILPNSKLNTTGTLTSFFPYMFVELTNATTMSRNVNNLYTNNQYGQSALFAVPISDVSSPVSSQFLNLNSASIQTVKFKPNDSLHFRVFLTNGMTFTPVLKDTLLPMVPNALVQVSAIFSIRKVD